MMPNLDSLEEATRNSAVEMIRALNSQFAGLDEERDKRIVGVRGEYVERRKTLRVKRTEWLRRVKGLLDKKEYEKLVKVPEKKNGSASGGQPEPEALTEAGHESVS